MVRTQHPDVWQDTAPIRADLFGTERLEHHAQTLAAAQVVAKDKPLRVRTLSSRVKENGDILLRAYRTCAQALQAGQTIAPAAEWLLDNFHLVEQQLRQIHDDLPPGYYRQLPKLAEGPFAGYPRVFGLAWAYVAHSDSLMSGPVLARYVRAYQQVQPLMIGELWAVAITLRIVLIENMRRLALQIVDGHALRVQADAIVDAVLAARQTPGQSQLSVMQKAVTPYEAAPLPEIVAAQIAKRLRGFDPLQTPLFGWLEDRLHRQSMTIDDVVANAQLRLGASNVTMRNIVTSMRLVSEMDWADFFEEVSLIDAVLRDNSTYAAMDFATRNRYRTEFEILARGSKLSENAVTDACLALAATGSTDHDRDPGYWLIGQGRATLEAKIAFDPPVRMGLLRKVGRLGLAGYLATITVVTLAILALALLLAATIGAGFIALVILGITGLVIAAELGSAIVNTIVTRTVPPKPLPGLDLAKGIPVHLRTLVGVPVLLQDAGDLAAQIERLEVHHLSSTGGAVHYALLSDTRDSAVGGNAQDAPLIATAIADIARLNARYPSEDGDRFYFLHRHHLWNPAEGVWMGWERKRGKLAELNRLLRGAADTSFAVISSPLPTDIRYVITLDADTRLLRGTVAQMVGKIAHPLNQARLDAASQRVTGGYGILQPRVSPTLPTGHDGSVYQQLFSSPGGIEPYAAATSDVYQDLFDEGSFTGKGIYDVDAFEAAMAGRVPENTLLSHDLFEGVFARAALASDIEVVEDFPARYDVDIRRQHRWARGDWQLVPWIFGKRRADLGGIPPVGRWKMIDNLRRSLLAPMAMLALFSGWMMPPPVALLWTILVVVMLALPRLLSLPFGLLPARAGVMLRSHFAALGRDALTALGQIALNLVFLADSAATMLDAIFRTAWRLTISRRHLLEWVTAARSGSGALPTLPQQYLRMMPGVLLGLGVCAAAWLLNPMVQPIVVPFALLWLTAPAIARAVSLSLRPRSIVPLSDAQARDLRLIARKTWRYFETFVTAEENFLPPDNFQEIPKPAIATRTSPTNIGLYLLSTVTAHDMGWIGLRAALLRMKNSLLTIQRMPRYRGHLYNWHDTRDLRVLEPAYVSSVDSGNLAGHLIAVAQACRGWAAAASPDDTIVRQALGDTAALARSALESGPANDDVARALDDIVKGATDAGTPLAALLDASKQAMTLAQAMGDTPPDIAFWTAAIHTCLAEYLSDQTHPVETSLLSEVETLARTLAMEMDFSFLLEPDKKLLSIGFSVATNRLDTNCYDLLASEARLASLFAIAKGDVETRHWFRLGRPATPIGAGSALISWSGSMFEYLMPSLVMRAPIGSVLEQTTRLIVARQKAYAAALGIPWGISESSYNARDLEMTYQYSNFGVPGLGLKRGLSENRVIAPYATGLAAMIDPAAAVQNYANLATLGADGRYGYYEAVDFTSTRLQSDETHAVVRSFMAHHQGMTITAIANTLHNGRLRDRFHAEPMIQGVELLLQERIPRDVASAPPRATEVLVAAVEHSDAPAVRTFDAPATETPTAHLLSNGNYGVMLTPTGEGFSCWRDMAITRWRAEPTQAALGSFIFMRDTTTGAVWSAGMQPTGAAPDRHRAVFCEHHAAFTHTAHHLMTTTEVVVSAEDDAEARRVTFTNSGRRGREIDVTSYAELVLAPQSSDQAHPAFSKMFVVTDYLPELGVIIATRRRRSPHDPEVWAAHIAVIEGQESGPIQIETDRAKFIGRGRSIADAAMTDTPLSGTTGTVLDPIFSIRRRVTIPPGGVTRVTFWTMVAASPDALLDLVDRHRDPSAFARAATLAWTQAQVQLRHLGITHAAAADFQTLGGMVMRNDPRLRATPAQIIAGAAPQSALWALGISGDLPIVLLQIEDADDIGVLHEVLSAHEYWEMRQLAVDLVILNDRSSSYVQDLQIAIDSAVRAARSRPRAMGIHAPVKGTVHALRSDLLNPGARAQLLSMARVVLVASRGDVSRQIAILTAPSAALPVVPAPPSTPPSEPDLPKLEFFNGTGGFADQGREYVTVLRNGQTTPAPWINVIANPSFGFQVSAEGSGHVWSENSRENQITPWSNDPVTDPAGEAIYLHDLDTGNIWTPTARPMRGPGTYIARHGFGYSTFQHETHGIAADMVQFVPLDAAVKVTRLRLENKSSTARNLSVTAYAEWVLGTARGASAPFIITRTDPATGAILAQNTFSTAFPGRVAFADFGSGTTGLTADRAEFIGPGGSLSAPVGLHAPLSGKTGPALDPCAALQRRVSLRPGETKELVFLLGQADSNAAASTLIAQMRATDTNTTLDRVKQHWADLLTSVQVTSPDRAMDILLNGWLMYQTLACRIWARAGFYQASGAYGFRDQLQDGMALTFSRPEMTRAHLLRAASRQFPEGDVQHWWLPHSGQGVRTRISDDRVWLGYGVARYIDVSGDATILDEQVPFLQGPAVPPGAHDDFFQPQVSDTTATLFEHCARGLDQAIEMTGENGMPLIGTGDWNDGMNRVGEGGRGTSVWLGWLLIATVDMMAPLADSRDPARATRWRAHAKSVLKAIETDGWDGAWYRRGTFDDGTILGSATSDECRIDSIAQSWAVLSGAADPARARTAMASMTEHLVRPDPGLALLFTPPFDRTPLDPGYIKGYPPGLRENGGQYSHAAMWAILAQAKLGDGDAAHDLFAMLNPINHALTPQDAARYKVEPYVVAADVYSTAPHAGRGGWTWYTGSAGWMYRAGVEGLLGLSRSGSILHINPCIPKAWPELTATITLGAARYTITICNPGGAGKGIRSAVLNGTPLTVDEIGLAVPLQDGIHHLTVVVGSAMASKTSA
jgi:cyclic beta-1,2-glucan synthetase